MSTLERLETKPTSVIAFGQKLLGFSCARGLTMALLGNFEILLIGLEEKTHPRSLHYVTREYAHTELKRLTGQDFGYNSSQWREYLRANREKLGVAPFEKV